MGSKVPPKIASLKGAGGSLFQNLDPHVAEVDFHGRTAMQLKRKDAFEARRIVQVGGDHAVQRELDVIAVAEDLVVVPVLELDYFLRLALPDIHQRAAALFLIDVAPVIVLGGIGLV